MSSVSIGEYHGLRVGAALLSIVAGCVVIGVSRECDADAVGGIFLGAGGLGLLISVYPFIRAWLNINHILPSLGIFTMHNPHYTHYTSLRCPPRVMETGNRHFVVDVGGKLEHISVDRPKPAHLDLE
ncbi:kinocilin [Lampris incognitus]|uniref:kinocilin n=1 Tax=Lampris incognitus TaxID=2546036 RepID=UPI0024B5B57E|nr:kinocilin [Lampris incognitus]